ncbi:hypothetical protein QVD17_04612 [Tagetes erecta]|uniref:Uncharacterized protein n=1 Tax=Tagetes erecta TaxID=13708 RepID=A0AAD8LGM3_TARER|nr:hypothetical protein QVD17_04612 [Tagetes erecta]
MPAATGFSYQRLRNEAKDEDHYYEYEEEVKRAIDHVKSQIRRSSRFQRVHMKKRLKMKIPSLKKLMRRRGRLVMVSMAKVIKRLKESQSHFGDLFAGNYLFMQINPPPLKSKSSSPYACN